MSDHKTFIYFVKKNMLSPKYGTAIKHKAGGNSIWVREDLPEHIKAYVFAHELYHLHDKSKHWLWREIKATIAGVVWPVWGLVCVLWDFVAVKERRDFMIDRMLKKY